MLGNVPGLTLTLKQGSPSTVLYGVSTCLVNIKGLNPCKRLDLRDELLKLQSTEFTDNLVDVKMLRTT